MTAMVVGCALMGHVCAREDGLVGHVSISAARMTAPARDIVSRAGASARLVLPVIPASN